MTDALKSVRVIAYNAALAGARQTVNIKNAAPAAPNDRPHEQPTRLQVTAAQALANPNRFQTVMDAGAATIPGLTTIIVVGYTAPN